MTVATKADRFPLSPLELGSRPLVQCSAQPLLRFLRYVGISALVGIGIVLITSLAIPGLLNHRELLAGALMGVAIGGGSMALELGLLGPLLKIGVKPVLVARSFCYGLGGALGYLVGVFLIRWIMGLHGWSVDLKGHAFSMLLYAGLAIAVGMTFYTVEELRTRLATSVDALRGSQYAQLELDTARTIQKRLMPPERTSGPGFDLAASNRAASFVAGDFYDYFHLPDGTMGFVVGDVAGKGIGASLQMASVKAVLPLVAASQLDTGNPVAGTLDQLNERLCKELGRREFVALLYGRFDAQARTMEFANAGLPDPYWISREEPGGEACVKATSVEGERLPLGARPGTRYSSRTLSATGSGMFVLFTDGVVEARTGDEPLGYERLEHIFAEIGVRDDPSEWLAELHQRLEAITGSGALDDDSTVMVIRNHAGASEHREQSFREVPAAREERDVVGPRLGNLSADRARA